MKKLAGKIALVTGAGRGIGKGIAIELARCGAIVGINDLREDESVNETIQACREVGGDGFAAIADVSNRSEMKSLVDSIVSQHGGIDIAVSNAAYSDRHLMVDQCEDEFDRTISVSMMGAYHLVRYSAEAMIQLKKGGSIVVVSSPHAHMPIPGALAYNMAKAACDQLGKTAACELAQHSIRVNVLHPGWIDTPGERKFFSEDTLADAGEGIPMGRLGTPKDLGRGVVFLCDPESDYVTGSTLTIDGGIQLPFKEMYRIQEALEAED